MSFTWQLMNLQADLFQLFTKGNKIKDKNIIQVSDLPEDLSDFGTLLSCQCRMNDY